MSLPPTLSPEVRTERCTRYRYRYSACTRCADQCPHQALTLDEEGVSLDAVRCAGCALCDGACPTGVFQARNLALAVPADPAVRHLAIACIPSEQPGDVRVPCLGALNIALLAGLGRRGFTVTLRGSGHCEQCAHAPQGAARLQALLDALAQRPVPRGTQAETAEGDGVWLAPILEDESDQGGLDRRRAERRRFFRSWMARGIEASRDDAHPAAEVPASAIRVAAHSVPARRRLTETLWRPLDAPLDDALTGLTWAMASVEVGEHPCSGCEACARVCPTGALKVSEDGDYWGLIATPAQCVGCGVCIEACHTGAIALRHGRRSAAPPWSVLHRLRRFRCDRCGRFFIGLDSATCPVCLDDDDGFSAIFG